MDRLDIISVHIPKTAGTSFYHCLKTIYGTNDIARVYTRDEVLSVARGQYQLLISGKKILHGHFRASRVLKERHTDATLIIWVRNPVDRIISYYHYLKRQPVTDNRWHARLIENNLSLPEFAALEGFANQTQKFFGDLDAADFDFIGTTENYAEDIRRLSQLMGWNKVRIYRKNKSRGITTPPGLYRELERMLADELQFYRGLLDARPRSPNT